MAEALVAVVIFAVVSAVVFVHYFGGNGDG